MADKKQTREERIKALNANEKSPVRTLEALKVFSDVELDNLEAHVAKKAQEAIDKAAADEKAAADLKAAEAAKGTTTTPTDDEYLKTAPQSIKDIVASFKASEATKKEKLIGELKDVANGVYSEAELKAMGSNELERLVKLAGKGTPKQDDTSDDSILRVRDFSGRGLPRAAAARDEEEDKKDVFLNPPDPYAAGLAKMRGEQATK